MGTTLCRCTQKGTEIRPYRTIGALKSMFADPGSAACDGDQAGDFIELADVTTGYGTV